MNEQYALNENTPVRLRHDPGRKGITTGKVRERAGNRYYQVRFPEGVSYQPDYELEPIEEDAQDAFDLLEKRRFGRVNDLRRNLSQIQLRGRVANLVYSMDTTNTEFLAYQFKPVLSFLESPSNGLLIADEVGLGKTIEAGLIWTELRARYDARRLVVVSPAMLREKWRDELSNRFAVDARIENADGLLKELRQNKNQIPDGKGIVCSLQGLRPPARFRDEDERTGGARRELARFLDRQAQEEYLIDLLIIDEAHYLRNPESQTAKLGHLLREVSENVVLLSATPINLRDDDLFHLLNLVDPDSFDVKEVFPQVLAANEPLQKARKLALDMNSSGEQIVDSLLLAQGHPLLSQNRQLKALVQADFSPEVLADRAQRIQIANRIERINLLRHAVNRTRKVEVTEWRVVREPYTSFVELPEAGVERQLYEDVTAAVRRYAIKADISDGFLLATPQRQLSSCMYAAVAAWRGKGVPQIEEQVYEDFGTDASDSRDSISPLVDHLRRTVVPTVDLEELRENDHKYAVFRSLLLEYLNEHKEEKIIVFSYFRGTLKYLSERLLEDGINSQVLVGGMAVSKQDVINNFRDSESVRVLLSSEVASEGVDLQFSRVVVNYDLPWNPMKIEQRIGRVDRIGQTSDKISVVNICYEDTIDERIYHRLFERLRIFERALGGMEALLGEKISDMTSELLRHELTPEQESARIDATALAIEKIRKDQEELDEKASHLIAHGGYIMEQVQAAHEFGKRITEDDLVSYVKDYLDRYAQGHRFKEDKPGERLFRIKLSSKLAANLEDYIQKKKIFGQTRLATGEEVSCRFLNKVRDPRSPVEYISQFHPLVRFISDDLTSRDEAFHALVAVEVSATAAEVPEGTYGFAIKRWSFEGLRVEEELRGRVVHVDSGRMLDPDASWELVNRTKLFGSDWLSVGNEIDVERVEDALDACEAQLQSDFEAVRRSRENENSDRVNFQVASAEKHRDRQLASLKEVLNEHRARGRTRLIAPTEGRIRKVRERFDVQAEKLRQKEQLRSHPVDVCMGVLSVR